ncbi:MAG TPA: hypothetical protein VFB77_15275 [Acidimicrobiales bacterium]|nr:hypothetical protein [Acidimicrobiales bacterium]
MFTHHDFTSALADERRHHLQREAATHLLVRAVRRAGRRPSAPSGASPPRVIDLRTRAAAPEAVDRSHKPAA